MKSQIIHKGTFFVCWVGNEKQSKVLQHLKKNLQVGIRVDHKNNKNVLFIICNKC